MSAGGIEPETELSQLLERASYQITTARGAGLGQIGELRAALKRAREALADAESLAADVDVRRRERE